MVWKKGFGYYLISVFLLIMVVLAGIYGCSKKKESPPAAEKTVKSKSVVEKEVARKTNLPL